MATVVFIDATTKRYQSFLDDVVASQFQGQANTVIYDGDDNILTIRAILPHAPYLIQDSGTLLIRDMVQAEKDSLDADNAAALLAATRTAAKNGIAGLANNPMLLRAIGAVLVDEVNLLRDWITAFEAAVAAATTLSDLKTRVAGLATFTDRTLAQFKTAIQNKIDSGNVDN